MLLIDKTANLKKDYLNVQSYYFRNNILKDKKIHHRKKTFFHFQ